MYKLKLNEEVVGMFLYDFRQEDNVQLLVVTKSGTIKGINIHEEAKKVEKKALADEVRL